MTLVAARSLEYTYNSGVKHYLSIFDGSVRIAFAEIPEQQYFGECSLSFDGRYAAFINEAGGLILDSRTSELKTLPFTTKYLATNGYMGIDSYGPRFHPSGYLYNADFSQRIVLSTWAFEGLPEFLSFGSPVFVEFDAASNCIWVAYATLAEHGTLLRCFDLNTRQERALPNALALLAVDAIDPEYAFVHRLKVSPSGEYLLWARLDGPNTKRQIINLISGEVQDLPASHWMVHYRGGLSVFTDSGFLYADQLNGDASFSSARVLIKNLRTASVISTAVTLGLNPVEQMPYPWNPYQIVVQDGRSLGVVAALGFQTFPMAEGARGIDVLTGELIAPPAFFTHAPVNPSTSRIDILSAATQPQIMQVNHDDGYFWTDLVYAKELVS